MIFHQPGNSKSNFHYNVRTYSDKEYAPHFHKNMELLYVYEGIVEVTVNGLTELLSKGNMALVLSNQIHAFSVPKDSKVWVVVFSEDHVPAFTACVKGKQGTRLRFEPDSRVLALFEAQIIHSTCTKIMRKACLYAICDQYLQQVELETRQEKSNFLVANILDWIASNYKEDISLQLAAEKFGYEYHYLSRLLNRNYAISFTALLNAYRLEHAITLLENSDAGISDIANASGFQSIRSFNLCFKNATGLTPKDYRQTR